MNEKYLDFICSLAWILDTIPLNPMFDLKCEMHLTQGDLEGSMSPVTRV